MRLILTALFLLIFISANAEAPINTRTFVATAYCLKGITASGERVRKGIVSADPRVLPLGTKVHIEAGEYSGTYVVGDTGSKIKENRLDIWVKTRYDAVRFGKRDVLLTVISYGSKKSSRSQRKKPKLL